MRSGCWLVAVLVLGCAPAASPAPSSPRVAVPAATDEPVAPTPPTPRENTGDAIRATLRIDAKPGGKKFQGVWLEREDGEKWVISYRPDELWRGFQDKLVQVRGAIYQPRGQAIRATHFRVEWLAIVDDDSTDLVEVKEERTYAGQFEEHVWPAGTKLAGEKTPVFQSDGRTWFLANRVDPLQLGQKVEVRAREVVPSSHVARPGGPFLWILEP